MIRGTTPTFTLTIQSDDIDLTAADDVYVTFQQGAVAVSKKKNDPAMTITDAQTVEVWLTQEESLKFAENTNVDVQINWTYSSGTKRAATRIKSVPITRQLLKRVIE